MQTQLFILFLVLAGAAVLAARVYDRRRDVAKRKRAAEALLDRWQEWHDTQAPDGKVRAVIWEGLMRDELLRQHADQRLP